MRFRRETIGAVVFRRRLEARRLDTRRRRFAPLNFRGESGERTAEAVDEDEQFVPQYNGTFGDVRVCPETIGSNFSTSPGRRLQRCYRDRVVISGQALGEIKMDAPQDGSRGAAGRMVSDFRFRWQIRDVAGAATNLAVRLWWGRSHTLSGRGAHACLVPAGCGRAAGRAAVR